MADGVRGWRANKNALGFDGSRELPDYAENPDNPSTSRENDNRDGERSVGSDSGLSTRKPTNEIVLQLYLNAIRPVVSSSTGRVEFDNIFLFVGKK